MAAIQTAPPMNRLSSFGFACGRCGQCCREKIIQLNPYEVARLAGCQGLSTTAFIRRHTLNGGTRLRFDSKNVCPFLDERGCCVHGDRPLVCRLYPLGRHVSEAGEEWFTELRADAGCRGVRNAAAPIRAYLEGQGALPYMRAADLYLDLYWRLAEALGDALEKAEPEAATATSWTDLDAALRRYCGETGARAPEAVDDKMVMHIQAIETWAKLPKKGGSL